VGAEAFHPTVLVGQRNRLRASKRPRRFLEDTKVAAREAGVLRNRARVLDSTPIYDAVATQDTVTQLRAAIRKLLMVLDNTDAPLVCMDQAEAPQPWAPRVTCSPAQWPAPAPQCRNQRHRDATREDRRGSPRLVPTSAAGRAL
jgi:hypothetical protein